MELAQSQVQIREVAQTIRDGHHVHRGVPDRQPQCVAADESEGRRVVARSPSRRLPAGGSGKHGRAEIHRQHPGTGAVQGERDVTGAAADVERGLVRCDGGAADQLPFPAPMQSEALQVVDQVVAGRYGVEQRFDAGGALFAQLEIAVGHARRAGRECARGAWTFQQENAAPRVQPDLDHPNPRAAVRPRA